jgi:glycosyltransferase involved in cell wall biosynthesis
MWIDADDDLRAPPLRILQLDSMLTGGGTDDQCIKLSAGLLALGQTVWLAGPDNRPMTAAVREKKIPLIDTRGSRGLGFILRAAKAARRERVQIIHGHHGRDLWPTVLAARLSGQNPKIVLTRHLAKSPSSWMSRNFLLGQCDAVIAVSKFVEKVLREGVYEPDSREAERRARPPLRGDHAKIRTVYGGIDTKRFHPASAVERRRQLGLDPEHFAFAVVGGYYLPRGKGQREFLAAAARIHEKVPNARFLIIGRGDMQGILEEDIRKLQLTGKAWLPGYASDMPEVMNAIDCLVHCQVGTEALGLVVCEANACGKPVIASALDGIPEAVAIGNYGQLVEPENVEQLAAAMTAQACKPRLTEAEAGALHSRIDEIFSIEHSAKQVLGLYRELLAR